MIHHQRSQITILFICVVLLSGLLPLGIYWIILGSVPTIHAAEALEILANTPAQVVLVDVRSELDFQERRILGSFSLPLAQITELDAASDLPPSLQDKTLFLVCEAGVLSAQATRYLIEMGVSAVNLRGGMQDWGRAWPQFEDNLFSRFELAGGVVQEPYRAMSTGEQAAASLALLVMQLTPRTTLHPLARVLFCAGAGFFGFGLFRVTLGMVYAEALVWATFWEELTELLFVCAVIYLIWVYHHTLLPGCKIPKVLNEVLH